MMMMMVVPVLVLQSAVGPCGGVVFALRTTRQPRPDNSRNQHGLPNRSADTTTWSPKQTKMKKDKQKKKDKQASKQTNEKDMDRWTDGQTDTDTDTERNEREEHTLTHRTIETASTTTTETANTTTTTTKHSINHRPQSTNKTQNSDNGQRERPTGWWVCHKVDAASIPARVADELQRGTLFSERTTKTEPYEQQ